MEWSPLLALQRATHATLDALAEELADLALPASEINVLANLADGGPHTISSIGAAVGSRPTTMTSVLDRLEGRGWTRRVAHPSDRRALLVELTPAGRRVAGTVREAIVRVEGRALAGLSQTAVAALRRGLAALAEQAHER